MLPQIEQLLVIQDRDQKLRLLSIEVQAVPLEKQRYEKQRSDRQMAVESIKDRSRELEVRRKNLELDARAKRDTVGRYKTQQFQTRKNEEFQALGHEIERLENTIVEVENAEIDVMEESEKLGAALKAAEQEWKGTQTQVESQLAALEKKRTLLEQRTNELRTEREKLATDVAADLLDQYNRLFASKGGNAVVAIDHEVCTGCHMKNTTTTVHRAKLAREIVRCEQCGRMIY